MTLTYSLEVSTANLYNFHRLLFRWRSSVWQAVWQELSIWLALYSAISFTYRYFLINSNKRSYFEDTVRYCENYSKGVPITFILGFYVSLTVKRWWEIYMSIPWPDNCALAITSLTRSKEEEKGRLFRRTMVRYLMLAEVMVFRDVSSSIKKRFPTYEHVKLAGLITDQELKQLEGFNSVHPKYWIPLQWTCTLLKRARDTGFLTELAQLRIVKVVNIAVRSFFLMCLFGRQYIIAPNENNAIIGESSKNISDVRHTVFPQSKKELDLYVPFFTILQFIFFVGWLKVAEVLINPLGEDDDDFEVNYIIDRNFQIAYDMVDENYDKLPPLEEDIHWNSTEPPVLLHTVASAMRDTRPMMGSCFDVSIAPEDAKIAPVETTRRTSMSDAGSNSSAPKHRGSITQGFHSLKHTMSTRASKFKTDSMNLEPVLEDEYSRGSLESVSDPESGASSPAPTPNLLKKKISTHSHILESSHRSFGGSQKWTEDPNAELFAVSVAPTAHITVADSAAPKEKEDDAASPLLPSPNAAPPPADGLPTPPPATTNGGV